MCVNSWNEFPVDQNASACTFKCVFVCVRFIKRKYEEEKIFLYEIKIERNKKDDKRNKKTWSKA